MGERLQFLQSVPYFAGLPKQEVQSIEPFILEKSYSRNEVVLLEGGPGDAFYIIVSGRVKIFKTSPEGKEQILRIMRERESFNEVPLFDGGLNPASAITMEPTVLYGIRRSDIEVILRNHPAIAANIIKALATRIRYLVSLVEDLSFRSVMARIARVLLDYAQEGERGHHKLTQQEMAALVGTAREVISRALKTLEERGAIRRERHRIFITDAAALKQTAEMSP